MTAERPVPLRELEVDLPNGSAGDALVHLRWRESNRSFLFDAGDPRRLDPRHVLRIDQLFVSHCHVDHFVGFDALVRPRVCRAERMTVHGPDGFLDRVEARLRGYDWNLTEGNHFVIDAREVREDRVLHARFDSGSAFERRDLPDTGAAEPWVTAGVAVESVALEHRIPCRGWAVRAPDRLHVDVDALARAGLTAGPWLAELKQRSAAGDGSAAMRPGDGPERTVAELARELLVRQDGERVAYVTDTLFTDGVLERVCRLADGAALFACEAPFLEEDGHRARQSRHLTAGQAGTLAAAAGARRLLLFHVSDRYGGELGRHVEEASRAAGGGVEVLALPPLVAP